MTANSDQDKALLKRFHLFGPPATIFSGSKPQREVPGSRVIGFESADRLLVTLARVPSAIRLNNGRPDECLLVPGLETPLPDESGPSVTSEGARTRPASDGGRDQYAEYIPDAEERRCELRTVERVRQGADGPRGEAPRRASQAKARRREPPSPRRCRRTAEWISALIRNGQTLAVCPKINSCRFCGAAASNATAASIHIASTGATTPPAPSQAGNPAAPAARRPPGRWRRALRRTLPWPRTSAPTSPAPMSGSVRAIRKSKVSCGGRPCQHGDQVPAQRQAGVDGFGPRREQGHHPSVLTIRPGSSPPVASAPRCTPDFDRRRRHVGQSRGFRNR